MTVIIGFTGTRAGMTIPQKTAVETLLRQLKPDKAVHGGAVGADTQFHAICKRLGIPIEVYPCPAHVVEWSGALVHPTKPPLVRNKIIVGVCNYLIGAPLTSAEQRRGGTWSTIRRARKTKVFNTVVNPNGSLVMHNGLQFTRPTTAPTTTP